jgi:hypothetical protein
MIALAGIVMQGYGLFCIFTLMTRPLFTCLILVFFCTSCLDFGAKKKDTAVQFTIAKKKGTEDKIDAEFSVDSADKVLVLTINLKNLGKISVPIDREKKDTLRCTALRCQFLFDGKPIPLNASRFKFLDQENSWLIPGADELCFRSDTFFCVGQKTLSLRIPFYLFSAIPAGKKKPFQVKIYQDSFFSASHYAVKPGEKGNETDSVSYWYRNAKAHTAIDFLVSFNLDIPKIYSSQLICNQIKLQNDSSWGPAGSDVTIWKSSYPDIYFSTYAPNGFLVHSSAIEKSTAEWSRGDTCEICFYSESDPVEIWVMDYDHLSKDDVIGTWSGTLKDLRSAGNTPLKFGHITTFRAKLGEAQAKN